MRCTIALVDGRELNCRRVALQSCTGPFELDATDAWYSIGNSEGIDAYFAVYIPRLTRLYNFLFFISVSPTTVLKFLLFDR